MFGVAVHVAVVELVAPPREFGAGQRPALLGAGRDSRDTRQPAPEVEEIVVAAAALDAEKVEEIRAPTLADERAGPAVEVDAPRGVAVFGRGLLDLETGKGGEEVQAAARFRAL